MADVSVVGPVGGRRGEGVLKLQHVFDIIWQKKVKEKRIEKLIRILHFNLR